MVELLNDVDADELAFFTVSVIAVLVEPV